MSDKISAPLELGDDSGRNNRRPNENYTNTEDNEVKNSSLAKIFDFINVKKIGENINAQPDRIKVKDPKNRDNFEVSHISSEGGGSQPSSFYDGTKKSESDDENKSEKDDEGDDKKSKDSEESIDWDEEIGDDDIRYVLAADKAVEYILSARANAIKPGYEEFKKLVDYAETLKMILIFLISIFVVLSRPIWCANMGSKINWECTRSQDPENPIEYYRSELPVLSAETKRIILLSCMVGIFLLDLMRIIITRGDQVQRVSFYFCMLCLVCYSIGFYFIEFKILKITFLDIFALLYVIFGIKILQKTLLKFMTVLINAKEILIFFFLFMATIAMVARLLFFRVDHYYDAEGTTFGFNFQNFSNSLYSLTIANFLADNFFDVVSGLMADHKILVTYWLVVIFLNKFMLGNFLCGILYNCYNNLFSKDIDYMNRPQFKNIKISLKKEIVNENLKGSVFKKIMTNYMKTGNFDKNIEEIENFYSLTMNNKHRMEFDKGNPDSFSGFFNTLREDIRYIVTLGCLEGFNYIMIIITFEMDEKSTYPMIGIIVTVNFLLTIDRFLFLLNNFFGENEKWMVLDIVLSLLIMGLGMQCLAISENLFYTDLMTKNRYLFKWLCSLFVCKSIRFLKLFGYNKQIAVVTKVIFDSFAFLKDILGIIMIFFFLFGCIGMAMFGGNVNSATPALFEEVYGDEPDMGLLVCNFNDYFFSIMTLFTVMLGGWTDIIKVNTVNFGQENNSMIYNIYFITYFFFVSLCFMNTLFGFLVDNVAANLDATIAELEEEKGDGEDEGEDDGDDDEGDEKEKQGPEFGDMREELDSFINSTDQNDNENKKLTGDEQSDDGDYKPDERYDPVDKALEKIEA